MKKIKFNNCNNLYILAILAILFIIIISITMKMKEPWGYTTYSYQPGFVPTHVARFSPDSNNPLKFNSPPKFPFQDIPTMYEIGKDHPNNTIITLNSKNYSQCVEACVSEPTCKGIVTPSDKNARGFCDLKKKMDDTTRKTDSTKSSTRINLYFTETLSKLI